MAKLTHGEMKALVEKHLAAEHAKDLEGIMATLSANPRFEYHPLGYALQGRVVVEEKYRRTISGLFARATTFLKHEEWFNEDSAVCEDAVQCRRSDGKLVTLSGLSIITFEGDKICGERMYFDDECSRYMDELLKDFWSFPGVSKI